MSCLFLVHPIFPFLFARHSRDVENTRLYRFYILYDIIL